MTASDRQMRQPCCDEVIAGEYVLGALSPEDCCKVEARLARDRQFAAMVSRWKENLATFEDDEALAPGSPIKTPCDAVFSGKVSGGCWNSLAFWRAVALASITVAAGLAASMGAAGLD